MICRIILLGLAGLTLAGEPDVFQNYFDDTVKEGSKDSDNDGLPDSFENNEQCFYKKMGWVDGAGDLNPDAIKGDLAGLESGTKTEFDGNIDKCASWNGDFGSRKKREAGETETEEEASNVPSVMESGSSALGWLKAAVRKTRSAEPGKKSKKNGAKNKRRRNGQKKRKTSKRSRKNKNKRPSNGRKKRRGSKRSGKKGKGGKAKKNKNKNGGRRRNGKKRTGRKGGKGKTRNGGSGGKGGKGKNGKKGGKGKRRNGGKKDRNTEQNGMADSTYNKLWCFDLSLEQVLEKCVEDKIKN